MSSDKFGDRRLAAAGAYESEAAPPRSSGLAGVAEVHVVLAVLAAFWGRVWGLGAPRHSPQLRESVLGRREAGGGPLGPPSLGDVGSLCCAPLQLPVSRPLPRLPTSTVPICGALGLPFFPPGLGALMCKEGQQGSRGAQAAD